MTELLARPPGQASGDWPAGQHGAAAARGPAARGAAARGPAARPRVVALVPAHNEAAAIDATIASLRRQTRPPDRILVVADNCRDATEDPRLV